MVVAKGHVLHFDAAAQFGEQGVGMCYAGDTKDVVNTTQVDRGGLAVKGLQLTIGEIGEEDFLVV